jgi:hypothetical protein
VLWIQVVKGVQHFIDTALATLVLSCKPERGDCCRSAKPVVGNGKTETQDKSFKQIAANHAQITETYQFLPQPKLWTLRVP